MRINSQIRAKEVRVIDSDGSQIGVIDIKEALRIAEDRGLDLVEVAPNVSPPVCKIMDYGKYLYKQKKKLQESKKKQKNIQVKEVKFRPRTDTHDMEYKINNMRKFITQGNRVKCSVFFRGREMLHIDLGKKVIDRVIAAMEDIAEVDGEPKMEGRLLSVYFMPKKKK